MGIKIRKKSLRERILDRKFDLIKKHDEKRAMFGNTFKHPCRYCRNMMTYKSSTIEHKIPISKGGSAGKNLALSCERCNLTKGSMTDHEFMTLIKDLLKCIQHRKSSYLMPIYIDRRMNLVIERSEKRLTEIFNQDNK